MLAGQPAGGLTVAEMAGRAAGLGLLPPGRGAERGGCLQWRLERAMRAHGQAFAQASRSPARFALRVLAPAQALAARAPVRGPAPALEAGGPRLQERRVVWPAQT